MGVKSGGFKTNWSVSSDTSNSSCLVPNKSANRPKLATDIDISCRLINTEL